MPSNKGKKNLASKIRQRQSAASGKTEKAPEKPPQDETKKKRLRTHISRDYGWDYRGPQWLARALEVDVRSIAVFRVCLSLCILWDILYEYLPEAWYWLSDEGSYPREVYMQEAERSFSWSLYLLNKSQIYPYILLTLHAIMAVIFASGIFPQLSAFVLWVLHMSLRERNDEVTHGGDALTVTCLTFSLFLPCDFYQPGSPRTYRRVDMGVFVMWCALFGTWIGNAFDKKGYEWHEDYTSVYLSLGMTNLVTHLSLWLRSTEFGWQLSRFLTFMTFWVEFGFPLACVFPGGELPWVRVLAASGLAFMHITFGFIYRLGDFAIAGLAICILILPSWFWDSLLPQLLRRVKVYDISVRLRQHFLYLYFEHVQPACYFRLVRDRDIAPAKRPLPRPAGPSPPFDRIAIVSVWFIVSYACYPCNYTFLIGVAAGGFTAGAIAVAKAMWMNWEQVSRSIWSIVAKARIVFLLVLGLSVIEEDNFRWTDANGELIVDMSDYGIHQLRVGMGLVPPRRLFASDHLGGGPGHFASGGWHVAAGITAGNEEVLDFWPFSSRTSPFAPFYTGDGATVPRPLTMEQPYLPADEYPHSRWENFLSRGSYDKHFGPYICQRFAHLNLTMISVYKIELREEPWREAPYFGWAPPSMYLLLNQVCPLADTLEEDRSWDFIDKKVLPLFKETYPPEKMLAPREFDLRSRLLNLVSNHTVKVRMRESYIWMLKGDVGIVDDVDDHLWDPPVKVTFIGEKRPKEPTNMVHFHHLEIISVEPKSTNETDSSPDPVASQTDETPAFTRLFDQFCLHRGDLEHEPCETADECEQRCEKDPKCTAAEFFAGDEATCSLSRKCTIETVVDANPDLEITLFIKN